MFLHLSVILFTEGGMCGRGHAWQGDIHGRGHALHDGGMHGRGACVAGGVHGRRDGHCSGRYATYWNAFLLLLLFSLIF